MENKNLATVLRESLSQQDLIDLGLIRNPIIDPHHIVNEIKETLSNYQDIGDELGIEYAGALTADDEPDQDELNRALDHDALINIRDEGNPKFKRSNFRYVEKQRNELGKYTRYILANGSERIVTDDELIDNPYLQYQRNLSDAREDGDFDEYNRLKDEWKATHFKSSITTDSDSYEQCFIKVDGEFIEEIDAINIPINLFKRIDKRAMNTLYHRLFSTLICDNAFNVNNQIEIFDKKPLISYLDMYQLPIKDLIKQNKQIQIINLNNKTMAIL